MKVFLTGCAGFIGSHTAEALLGRGDAVFGIDNFDPFYDRAIKERNLSAFRDHPRFGFAEVDIRDEHAGRLLREYAPDVVVHLAARAGVRASLEDPLACADINLRGTALIFTAAQRGGVRHGVFASSSSVYGERREGPFRETDRVDHPISPYAATKKAGELLAHTYCHGYGMSIACLRFFTAYGPRQRPEMAIHAFARAIERGEPLTMFGDGSAQRDFTYVEDIVDGIVRSIDRPRGYRVYNLGRGETVSVAEVIRLLEAALGRKAIIDAAPVSRGDVSLTHADISRARAELGYEPRTSLRDGIGKFVAWLGAGGA
jgi:UDP-glucuronate 4-epimerase